MSAFGRFVAVNKDSLLDFALTEGPQKVGDIPMSSNHPPPPCPPPDLIRELSRASTSFLHGFRNEDVDGQGKSTMTT
jgi:hypothetical protein